MRHTELFKLQELCNSVLFFCANDSSSAFLGCARSGEYHQTNQAGLIGIFPILGLLVEL